jgi:tetratricopeptide (TPR) repeat protein
MRTAPIVRLIATGVLSSALAVTGCSSSPQKKQDDKIAETETPTAQPSGPADDFVTQDVQTEEMPSAEALEGSGGDEAASTEVSSAMASDVAQAIRKADRGKVDAAARSLSRLIDEPGGFLAAYNLGVLRERQGLYEKAAKRYFQAVRKNPEFSPGLENLVRLYLRKGRVGDAERIARKIADQRPDNLGHRAVLLHISLYRGNYEDVIQTAKQILRKDERHVGAMFAMADANYHLGRHELAKSIIEGAIELQPERAELYYTFGLVELELEDKPAAMANFRKAIELQPQYAEAHNNLGVLYQEARDYAAAEDEFKAAIRAYPDFKEAYLNLGNAYKGQTKYKDAELAFKKAISIDPNFADAHFNLGILYLDGEVPGMDTISRLQKAIDSLNAYKGAARGQMASDDPVDKYIEEAKKSIEVERQKQEMMRETQMGAEQ